jgi:hypothetical protein
MSIFTFRQPRQSADDEQVLIIFVPVSSVTPSVLWETIAVDAKEHGAADVVHVLAPASTVSEVRDLLLSVEGRTEISRLGDPIIRISVYKADGSVHDEGPLVNDGRGGTPITWEHARQQGLMRIFNKRNGFLDGLPGFHFRNPSGLHTGRFIRAANLLVHGNEVAFIGLCVLEHIAGAERIYVDTSTISAIPHAAIATSQFLSPRSSVPHIDSFESYAGLRRGYIFENPTKCSVLISASTGGRLAKQIADDHGIPLSQILTLFFLSSRPSPNEVLCELAVGAGNPEGIQEKLETFEPEEQCPLCREGSVPISLVEDQFVMIPANPRVIEISKVDTPFATALRGLMERYYDQPVFQVRARDAAIPYRRPVSIEPTKLLESPNFRDRLEYAAQRFIPAGADVIVHLGGDESKSFAKALIAAIPGWHPKLLSASDLETLTPDAKSIRGVVVAAACAGRGSELRAISRRLRPIRPSSPRTYLVGFTRPVSRAALARLRSDLVFSDRKVNHEFQAVEELVLPGPGEFDPWEAEEQTLKKVLAWLISAGRGSDPARAHIEQRLATLRKGTAGLESLLWQTTTNPLVLNPTFALWNKYDPSKVVLEAAYVTTSSILQNARTEPARVTTSPFVSTVLAPNNFERFNDPLLEACLLRACRPSELNYTTSAELSREMAWTARDAIVCHDKPEGAVALEFAIALASGHLRLTDDGFREVIGCDTGEPTCKVLLEWLKRRSPS